MKRHLPLLFLAALTSIASAQNGLLIYKDQPWDKDEFARSVLYKKVGKFPTVHNVEPMKGETIRVNSALVLKDIPFPTPEMLRDIENEEQIKKLEALSTDWAAALKRFPQITKVVKPRLSELQNDIAQFHAGKVKSEGVWMTRDTYAAKLKKIADDRARLAAKLEEEMKRREAMASEWQKMDEADRRRMRDAKLQAQNASYAATQEQRIDEEIKRLEAIAAKRAQMKPAERLSTDTLVTPPGLSEENVKKYETAIAVCKEELSKGKEVFGFGLECQRFVLATPKTVYAFRPLDVKPEVVVLPGDEKDGTAPSLQLSCQGDQRGIDSFPVDGADASSVASVTIPTAKDADAKKLANSITEILEMVAAKLKPPESAAK